MSALITRDLVPAALRRWWRQIGHYPGRDLFTLFALFAEQAQAHPHRQAVVNGDGVCTYRELGWTGLDAMLADGPTLSERPEVDPAGPARILVSSGSEAAPKMATTR